ncbi:MAG: DNA-processing protein DprA [Phycisphaerales bacterium JB065]
MIVSDSTFDLLRLRLAAGVGPVIARRLLEYFGSVTRVLEASVSELEAIERVGPALARKIKAGLRDSGPEAEKQVAAAERLGLTIIGLGEPGYPALLGTLPDAPLVLFCAGQLERAEPTWRVAMVGSRKCTPYGIEQTERFSAALTSSGLSVVSGGARGIDTAAHRAAVRVGGRTVVVMGCGHEHTYPPENAELFRSVVEHGGALISEFTPGTPPSQENFPARNRIISGLSLGVLVVEAPLRSGALITARIAVEEHAREVMALPGRVDSPASAGSLDLIRNGSAAMITEPAHVLEALESAARLQHAGTHPAFFHAGGTSDASLFHTATQPASFDPGTLNETQRRIVESLDEPTSVEALARRTGLEPHRIRAEVTMLELRRVVERRGNLIALTARPSHAQSI